MNSNEIFVQKVGWTVGSMLISTSRTYHFHCWMTNTREKRKSWISFCISSFEPLSFFLHLLQTNKERVNPFVVYTRRHKIEKTVPYPSRQKPCHPHKFPTTFIVVWGPTLILRSSVRVKHRTRLTCLRNSPYRVVSHTCVISTLYSSRRKTRELCVSVFHTNLSSPVVRRSAQRSQF